MASVKFSTSVGLKLGILISGVSLLAFSLASLWFNNFSHQTMMSRLHHQALALYQQIAITRHWNASYGGVYVRKRPGVETNPYLYEVGPEPGKDNTVVPEIVDTEGNSYTLKNPALMSREISELTSQRANFRFHLTSLRVVNPRNVPDPFETDSLKSFELGAKEAEDVVQRDGHAYYRFMAPLFIEQACLECHGFQGYKLGEVRGGISLTLPMDEEQALLVESRSHFRLLAGGLTLLILFALLAVGRWLISNPLRTLQRFASGLGHAQQLPAGLLARKDEIGQLANQLVGTNEILLIQRAQTERRTSELKRDSWTDPLTGLFNRRYLATEGMRIFDHWQEEQISLALLMVDIDHFKRVKDEYGHQAGDRVLVEIAGFLRQKCRPYDLVVRYGGEEFLILLRTGSTGTGIDTAERILHGIQHLPINLGDTTLHVTVSIGMLEGNLLGDFDNCLRKADEAMYQAKRAGRNRIVAHAEETTIITPHNHTSS